MLTNKRASASCRDRGKGWVDGGPCACPRAGMIRLCHGIPTDHVATRTGTRPPPIPTFTHCLYRIRDTSLPILVVNPHSVYEATSSVGAAVGVVRSTPGRVTSIQTK